MGVASAAISADCCAACRNNGNETFSHSHLLYSDDGENWHIGAIADDLTNECAIAELHNGTIVMNARDYVGQASQTAHRSISWSNDGGESLSPGYLTPSLPDPIVEGAMVTDAAGKMLVFTHPANPRNRDHETVFSSVDGGTSWAPAVLLDANSSSYSSLLLLPNGSFAVQYNTGSTHMHRCITPPQLPSGAFIGCGAQFGTITFEATEVSFHFLLVAFHCLLLAFHCLLLAFHCLLLTFHCLLLTFHFLLLTFFHRRSGERSPDGRCPALLQHPAQAPNLSGALKLDDEATAARPTVLAFYMGGPLTYWDDFDWSIITHVRHCFCLVFPLPSWLR